MGTVNTEMLLLRRGSSRVNIQLILENIILRNLSLFWQLWVLLKIVNLILTVIKVKGSPRKI